ALRSKTFSAGACLHRGSAARWSASSSREASGSGAARPERLAKTGGDRSERRRLRPPVVLGLELVCLARDLLGNLERDQEVVPVGRGVGGRLAIDSTFEDERDQRLRKRLHLVELAGGNRILDLVRPVLANQIGDARVVHHHFDGGSTPAADRR